MDTVEELNGTYFYAGKSNLTAAELLFMIFVRIPQASLGLVLQISGPLLLWYQVVIISGQGRNPLERLKAHHTRPGLHVQCLKSQNFPLEYPFRHG
ncbi:membrane protein [Salmonella enterica subsp. enterica]|nr:membrane protein [Salmonella enterica subsp. enterica]